MSHFRRGQSKVWFGNAPDSAYQHQGYQSIYSSIDREFMDRNAKLMKKNVGDDEQCQHTSITSWISSGSGSRQGSPASHKSQDSGFSDAENSPGTKNLKTTNSNPADSPPNNRITITLDDTQSSPSVDSNAPTPPTVIRKIPSIRSPESHNVRRLTFSAPNSPIPSQKALSVCPPIDELTFESSSQARSTECTPKLKKRRPLCMSGEADDATSWVYSPSTPTDRKTYNNETVILGGDGGSRFNGTPELCKNLPTYLELFPTISTPKRSTPLTHRSMPHKPRRQTPGPLKSVPRVRSPSPEESLLLSSIHFNEYTNPLLNGHAMSVQNWLDETHMTCYTEVMSTLQTKSIAVEAARQSKVASMTAVQMIKNVQDRVTSLQNEFERTESSLKAGDELSIEVSVNYLVGNIGSFLEKVISKNIFQAASDEDLAKFEDNVDTILDNAGDIRKKILQTRDYNIKEDVLVIKRLVLIVIHAIFDRLMKVIVSNLEESVCQLILRSNLNYLGTLSSMNYSGFASLNDAFCSNGVARALLLVCLQEKQSSTRALALRVLATVCSSTENIAQFEQSGGIEVIKDILIDQRKRSEQEIREAISVLTQITAPWHGSDYKLEGLQAMTEALVEAITTKVSSTDCPQTLLLCAACINNLSRLEATAIYSIMANETILCFRSVCQSSLLGPSTSIFLYEQITSTVFNMSLNKRSHHHLADKSVIAFLIAIFDEKFYEKYETRAENEALRRTIKNLLHIFSRLIHESNVGHEILANNMVPIFSRVEHDLTMSHLNATHEFGNDITYINRKLNESLTGGRYLIAPADQSTNSVDIRRRQISYV